MTKVAYLDCPTGIAGDMCLGALVDAGVPLDYLTHHLNQLGLASEYQLEAKHLHHNGQRAMKVLVNLTRPMALPPPGAVESGVDQSPTFAIADPDADPPHPVNGEQDHSSDHAHAGTRHLSEIEAMIRSANLPSRATGWSLDTFQQLAIAEGAVHGVSPEQVHFHEVGATDAIVDIVGTCLGLDWLGIEKLYCSALPTGGGTIWAAHGRLPVPAPAVLKLWERRQVPIYSNGIQRELVTPTGAAIATTLTTDFGSPPPMTLTKVGLGAGSRQLPIPNILRLWIGDRTPEVISQQVHHAPVAQSQPTDHHSHDHPHNHAHAHEHNEDRQPVSHEPDHPAPQSESDALNGSHDEAIVVVETHVDDLSPQAIGFVMDELLQAGMLDVFTQAIGMKKSRPGILITVICRPDQVQRCQTILFRETTTLGIRQYQCQRTVLQREFDTVNVDAGSVRVKIARLGNKVMNVQPEYEDCATLARQCDRPWHSIHEEALRRWSMTQNQDDQAMIT